MINNTFLKSSITTQTTQIERSDLPRRVDSVETTAFRETDPEVMSFIEYIGASVRYDLFEGNFVGRIRDLKPNLFETTMRQ